jgi:hypothetical protein
MQILRKALREIAPIVTKRFDNSTDYWRRRYWYGGNSGAGSRGHSAIRKAEFVTNFASNRGMRSITELGSGDGECASRIEVPKYIGYDVSITAVNRARARCRGIPSHQFHLFADRAVEQGDLAISMDVTFHLVEDDIYDLHLRDLANYARAAVLIFSTDYDSPAVGHVRHRMVSRDWMRRFPEWTFTREPGGQPPSSSAIGHGGPGLGLTG